MADEKSPPPPSEALLISALADIIERLCVKTAQPMVQCEEEVATAKAA